MVLTEPFKRANSPVVLPHQQQSQRRRPRLLMLPPYQLLLRQQQHQNQLTLSLSSQTPTMLHPSTLLQVFVTRRTFPLTSATSQRQHQSSMRKQRSQRIILAHRSKATKSSTTSTLEPCRLPASRYNHRSFYPSHQTPEQRFAKTSLLGAPHTIPSYLRTCSSPPTLTAHFPSQTTHSYPPIRLKSI